VLDVSEQGLRFRAIAPVEQSGPILFWFTAHSNLIAGVGELVWTDGTKKNGGLRFTQLPYNACEQIRKWPYDSDFRPSIGKDLSLHIPAPDYSLAPGANHPGAPAAASAEATFHQPNFDRRPPESFETILEESRLSDDGDAAAATQLAAWELYLNKHGISLSKAICALLLVIILPAFAMSHRQAGKWLVWLGMKISGPVNTVASAAISIPPAPLAANTPAYKMKQEAAPVPVAPQPPSAAKQEPPKQAAPASIAKPEPPKQMAAAPPPAKAVEPQIRKPAAGGTELVVQVAALAQEEDARKMAEDLRQENFKAFVRTLPGDSLYRVTLGPYPDPASARTSIAKLKKAGFSAFIRREPVSDSLGT